MQLTKKQLSNNNYKQKYMQVYKILILEIKCFPLTASICLCLVIVGRQKKISESLLTPAERVYNSRHHLDICYFKSLCRQILTNSVIHILHLGLMLVSPAALPSSSLPYLGNELQGKPG